MHPKARASSASWSSGSFTGSQTAQNAKRQWLWGRHGTTLKKWWIMVIGGLRARRLFFPASNTNICHSSAYIFNSFWPGPTPPCCPHHLNLASPSWVRSLCLTKRNWGKSHPKESKGETKTESNKKNIEKHRAFSHCLNPLRVCTSLLSQIGIKNHPKICWKSGQREEETCCILLHGHTASEKLACLWETDFPLTTTWWSLTVNAAMLPAKKHLDLTGDHKHP